jgi:predicted PurR-regulated permease PerM
MDQQTPDVTTTSVQPRSEGPPRLATIAQWVAIGGTLVLAVWLVSDLVLVVFLAILIAIMLRGVSDWLAHHTGLPRHAMLAVVAVGAAAALLGLAYYIGPRLVSEGETLASQLQSQVDHLRAAYGNTPWGKALLHALPPEQGGQSHLASVAGTVATSTLGGLATAVVLIVTALYFAISPGLYVRGFLRLIPIPHRRRARHVLLDMGRTLKWWSLGQTIDMAVVGVLTGVGLLLLGVPLALALGVLAGLFTFVPYFGAIAAAVPAVLVALSLGWQTALWVALLFLGCHAIEGYVISPLVQRSTVDLPPAVTILSMTVLGTIFGPMGIVLGTPAAAALLVLVREVYVGDVLGDRSAARPDDRGGG